MKKVRNLNEKNLQYYFLQWLGSICARRAGLGNIKSMIMEYVQAKFQKMVRIFDGEGIFIGLTSHVPRFYLMKTWYQNVRRSKLQIEQDLRIFS